MDNRDIENQNPRVRQLVTLLDHALEERPDQYGTQNWHSLLWNLHNLRPEDWDTPPAPGSRTIREIVNHIGVVYLAYENHVFGDGTRSWADPAINGVSPGNEPTEVVAWLTAAHSRFRNSVAALTDLQLAELCPWGNPWTYQRIVEVMIQHPFYHVGEINYARAILQGNNDWYHQDIGRDPED